MALFDIFKRKSRKSEDRIKRPSKGALKQAMSTGRQAENKKPEVLQEEEPKVKKPKPEGNPRQPAGKSDLADLALLSPHVTEKATSLANKFAYVFRVSARANKVMIKRAIKELYGFDPLKINIVNVPSKVRVSRGKKGIKPGYKKAIIYLKEGDKIEV